MSGVKIVMSGRQSGRTAAAMLAAPQGAYYVWCNTRLDYPIKLAKDLGRSDLVIVGPRWLNRRNIMTRENLEIALDHATMLEPEAYQILQDIELRKKSHEAIKQTGSSS